MLFEERADYILKKLEQKSLVKTSDLVEEMKVSIDTIRRDLRRLEEEGKLTCIRGGACASEDALQYSPFFGRQIIHEAEKREAARKAVSLIHSENIIALNAGTTNAVLAEELLHLKKHITVVTNNLSVVSTLTASETIDLIVPGGIIDKQELSMTGYGCVEELSTYSFDLCFLSINAFHPAYGFSDFRFQEIDIMNAMIRHSQKTVAVMDTHKFNKVSKKLCIPTERINLLITDSSLDPEVRAEIEEMGLEVI